MRTYTDLLPFISGSEYEAHFWNAVRGKSVPKEQMTKGYNTATGGYAVTPKMQSKLAFPTVSWRHCNNTEQT